MKKTAIILTFLIMTPLFLKAQWGPVSICSYPSNNNVSITSYNGDNYDGVIMVWRDQRNYPATKLFAQKITPEGNVVWTSNGVELDGNLGSVSEDTGFPQLISDNNGGCIVVYKKDISGSRYVYSARINSDGTIPWSPRQVSSGHPGTTFMDITKSSSSEIIATWDVWQGFGYPFYIKAQKINFNGSTQWRDEVIVYTSTPPYTAHIPDIVSDGSGGAIISWLDTRNYPPPYKYDLYGQRLNSYGQLLWNPDGILIFSQCISDDPGDPYANFWYHNMVQTSDGAIMTAYREYNADIHASKVKLDGSLPWPEGVCGKNISNAVNNQPYSLIVSDNADGACILWEDYRSLYQYPDIFGKRIDGNGNTIWGGTSGIIISEQPYGTNTHYLAHFSIQDGLKSWNGEILIPWINYTTSTLYFQPRKILNGGAYEFFQSPVSVSTNADYWTFSVSPVIGLYATLGVVVYRESDNIFARAYSITWPYEPEKPIVTKKNELNISASPNPFNPLTTISYSVPYDNYISIVVYNTLGQQVKSLINNVFKQQGSYTITFNGENNSSGVYFVKIIIDGQVKLYKLLLLK